MHLARHLQQLPARSVRRFLASTSSTNYTSNVGEERIEIPNRIPRSSTDILQALAATVGRDTTASHYKYHDDPYLMPMSNVGKRTFAMAQESGRKAANWIKEQHRDLFMHQEAQPVIKEFAPKMIFTEDSEVDAETLEQLIAQSEITDAVFVYKLMVQKGIEVSAELKQNLLELICFYNNDEPLPEELIEERWFNQSVTRERHRKTWKDGDLAEQLYAEIEPKSAATYSALIRGMAKFYQVERAYALFQEATEKQFELDTATFNAIITTANMLRESADQRWDLIRDLLQQMSQQQLRPDLDTLNALLETVSTFGNIKFARSCALKVLAEFRKTLNIEPSPGTYYYLLIIFCRERGPVSHIIVDILREMADREYTIQHPKDTYFFATAMDVCRNHLHDKSLAHKVDALLHTGRNYDLIGDIYRESVYYRHFLALLCQTEPIEEFMLTYDRLVPNIYTPEPGIMEEILKAVEINAAVDLVPRFWSDMIIFDHTNRESLLMRILKIMVDNPPKKDEANLMPQAQQLPAQFAKIALDIYAKVTEFESRTVKKISFSGQMIGDILTVIVRSGDHFEKAIEVFAHADKNQHRIPGTPSEAALSEFVGGCIANKAPSQALLCLQYAVENNMEGLKLAQQISAGFTLNEVHLSKMKSLVGNGFLSSDS